ncbi:MAG: hypothetical protein AAF443_01070, partial [Chlamydiota bacterium]
GLIKFISSSKDNLNEALEKKFILEAIGFENYKSCKLIYNHIKKVRENDGYKLKNEELENEQLTNEKITNFHLNQVDNKAYAFNLNRNEKDIQINKLAYKINVLSRCLFVIYKNSLFAKGSSKNVFKGRLFNIEKKLSKV